MIIYNCTQGSTEWLQARAGIPTSSCFDNILTPKLRPSASAEKYLYKLLSEKIMGHPIIEHVSMWMQRGTALEQQAVEFYQLQRDVDTVPVGFVVTDDGRIGSSPDRLVGNDGLLEIKVPAEHTVMQMLLNTGSAFEAYRLQTLGQLWVTEREYCDLLAWHPELPPVVVRVTRDEKAIEQIAAAVTAFSEELERQFEICLDKGWAKKATPPRIKSMAEILKEELAQMNQEQEAGLRPSPSPSVP